MKALNEQTAEGILDPCETKFTTNSLCKTVVFELGTPRRDHQFFCSSTPLDEWLSVVFLSFFFKSRSCCFVFSVAVIQDV